MRYDGGMTTTTDTCNSAILCNDDEHTSMDCYFRYVMLEDDGDGGRIMTPQEWERIT